MLFILILTDHSRIFVIMNGCCATRCFPAGEGSSVAGSKCEDDWSKKRIKGSVVYRRQTYCTFLRHTREDLENLFSLTSCCWNQCQTFHNQFYLFGRVAVSIGFHFWQAKTIQTRLYEWIILKGKSDCKMNKWKPVRKSPGMECDDSRSSFMYLH